MAMNKKLIIIIAAVVILAAVGVGLYFFVFRETEPVELRIEHSIGDQFTTNVKNSTKMFVAGMVIVVNEKGLEELISTEVNIIRDTVIFILRDLEEDDITAEGTQDALRRKLVAAINDALEIESVVDIRFNNFIMA